MASFGVKLRAVADTGPLLAAVQCGRVDLLQAFYEVLFVTPAQVAELERHGAGEEVQRLIADGFLVVVPLTEEEKQRAWEIANRIAALSKQKDPKAHLAEAQAMAIMQRSELGAASILVEERAAFLVAQELGLNPVGFVGVLLQAAEEQRIKPEEVLAALEACRQQGTFYSEALLREVVRRLGIPR